MSDTSLAGSTTETSTTSASSSGEVSSASATSESRPSSFAEAFESVRESGTLNPGGSTTDPSALDPATVDPESAAAEPAEHDATGQPAKGPIPFDRHEAILANTREKAQREIVSQVQSKYGGGIQLQQAMQADPVGTLTQLIDEAVDHPDLSGPVISALAKKLGARRNSGPDLTPIETEVGQVYTAEQVKALVEQTIAQRVGPIEQEREAAQQRERAAQFREQTRETVKSRLSQWESQPGFSENKAEIAEKQKAFVAQGLDTWTALGLAYAAVVPSKLQATQTTRFVQDAVRKANASTSNPATVAPTLKPRPKSFAEAFSQLRGA